MTEDSFAEVEVDWSQIPSLQAFESHIAAIQGISGPEAMPARGERRPGVSLVPEDYVQHKGISKEQLLEVYKSNGFETQFIMQDPFGHVGPTVACPIGFPFNLPDPSPELRKFNRWICRVHVDIATLKGVLISIPHIEPDPQFHKLAHFWDTYIKKHVIRGKEAVRILGFLGVQ